MFTMLNRKCSPHVIAEDRKLQESSRRFCETLVGHMFLNGDKMSYSTTLPVETMLVFLEYIFQFFTNNALPAVNSVDRENFMGILAVVAQSITR